MRLSNVLLLIAIIHVVGDEALGQFPYWYEGRDTVSGEPAEAEWPQNPLDWYHVYMVGYRPPTDPPYPRNFFTNTPPIDPNVVGGQFELAYEHGRYNLSSILFMYNATKDVAYLEEFASQATQTFSSTWFRDGDNGCEDGFLGWGMRLLSGPVYLGETVDQNTWHHMKVRVQDTIIQGMMRTRMRTWFNGRFFEGWACPTLSGDLG
jgi:hypothetical protein